MFTALIPAALLVTCATLVVVLRTRDRARAAATMQRLGLRAQDDACAALDRFGEIDRHRRVEVDLGGLVGRETNWFRTVSTSELKPKKAWIADDVERPGVIGAMRAHRQDRSRSVGKKNSGTTLGIDLVMVRLPFVVDGQFELVPYYTGYDPTSFGGAFDLMAKIGMPGRPVQDEVLGRWFMAADDNPSWRRIQTDTRLRSLLWSLRQRMPGAKEQISDRERLELESIFTDVPRTQKIEHIVIDGDLLVLMGQSGPGRVAPSDTLFRIGETIGRTVLPMSLR